MKHGVVFRINEKGQPGVFECPDCGAIGSLSELSESACGRKR